MNKKKIIFFSIIGALVFLLFILVLISSLSGGKNKTTKNNSNSFVIWTYGQDKDTFTDYINEYKKKKGLEKQNFVIENFDNYKEYNLALSSAFLRGEGPDVFMLNNNEISFLSEHTYWLDGDTIDIDEFSDSFVGFFGDDLIISSGEGEDIKNFISGVPMGYETLGIIYNRRYISADDLSNLGKLNRKIEEISVRNSNIIPLGIGFGHSIEYAGDIVTQFFMLEDIVSYDKVYTSILKTALNSYFKFGEKYIDQFKRYSNAGNTTLNGFMRKQVAMIVGYPSTLNKMLNFDNITVEKSRIEAKPFPEYSTTGGKALVNYDYFVINKDTNDFAGATRLLSYMSSKQGEELYLEKFKYYLPARLGLEDKFFQKTINSSFSKIKLKDFYNNGDMPYASFNKGIKMIYDEDILDILDSQIDGSDKFGRFRKKLECMTNKILNLKNLSKSCNIR